GVVAEIGGFPRTGLHRYLEPQLDQLRDGIGHRCDALFAGKGFARNAYALRLRRRLSLHTQHPQELRGIANRRRRADAHNAAWDAALVDILLIFGGSMTADRNFRDRRKRHASRTVFSSEKLTCL